MLIPAGPHGDSTECIRALEQEIRRLQQLLAVVRQSEKAADSDHAPTRKGRSKSD